MRTSATDRDRSRPRVLAIANQKGGVGKTTTAINLGTALAAVGEEVLIVDLDPQGNASTGLGVSRQGRGGRPIDVLIGEADLGNRSSSIGHTAAPLRAVDDGSARGRARACRFRAQRRTRLHDAIGRLGRPLGHGYSYMLIDCPPSLNLLTINALVAADAVLVPLQCEFFALEGLSQLLKTVERVRAASIRAWRFRAWC